ncbi:MAG: NAD(P)H-binding protein [Solirubrobacteraceae bacterium]
MIVVTGATGNVGSELVTALAQRGLPARAVVRDRDAAARMPAGIEAIQGDLELPESLTPAVRGADSVFLLGGWSDMPGLLRRVGDAGVGHVVLLTSRCVIGGQPDNAITRMWLDSEAAVRDSGVPWTFLHPSGYQSNALRWLPQLRDGDLVRAPWADVPIAAIDPADIAAVAATVLADPAAHASRAHELSGPEPLTPGQQVATLAEVLARPLRCEAVPDAQARADMAGNTPQPYIDAFFRFYSAGEFDDSRVVGTVQELTGRAPRRFAQWARDHADAFARIT